MERAAERIIRVNRLVIIAGPSCSGKSWFLGKIKNGKIPWWSDELKLDDFSSCSVTDGNQLRQISESEPTVDRMLLHHTISVWPSRPKLDRVRDPAENSRRLLRYESGESISAKEISVLTLVASSRTLVQRVRRRQLRKVVLGVTRLSLKHFQGLKGLNRRRRLYSDTTRLRSIYDQWLESSGNFDAKAEWLVDVEAEPRLRPATRLSEILGE